ncbi:MAG: helix-turn-helix domain-containing protein [Vulcanisaeta sp. AZ3]|jgi:predicted DNA-binding protein YlxM (UPF0122 family)
MLKLTKTEELVGQLYFNDGLKPKEIAQKLGISVNTVYKAISKYRTFTKNTDKSISRTHDEQKDNDTQSNGNFNNLTMDNYVFNVRLSIITGTQQTSSTNDYLDMAYQEELIKELKMLRELVGKLVEKVEELERRSNVLTCKGDEISSISSNDNSPSDHALPDFIRNNPWVDVIKSIYNTA